MNRFVPGAKRSNTWTKPATSLLESTSISVQTAVSEEVAYLIQRNWY